MALPLSMGNEGNRRDKKVFICNTFATKTPKNPYISTFTEYNPDKMNAF